MQPFTFGDTIQGDPQFRRKEIERLLGMIGAGQGGASSPVVDALMSQPMGSEVNMGADGPPTFDFLKDMMPEAAPAPMGGGDAERQAIMMAPREIEGMGQEKPEDRGPYADIFDASDDELTKLMSRPYANRMNPIMREAVKAEFLRRIAKGRADPNKPAEAPEVVDINGVDHTWDGQRFVPLPNSAPEEPSMVWNKDIGAYVNESNVPPELMFDPNRPTPEDAGPDFDTTQKLRKEFTANPAVKAFTEQAQAFGRIVSSVEDPSPAGDLALVFNFMKVLDPGSVVRESEFATAESAAAWLQQAEEDSSIMIPRPIASAIRKMATGQRLSPEQRRDFFERAQGIYSNAESYYSNVYNQYLGIVEAGGFDPANALIDYRYTGEMPVFPEKPPPVEPPPVQPAPTPPPDQPFVSMGVEMPDGRGPSEADLRVFADRVMPRLNPSTLKELSAMSEEAQFEFWRRVWKKQYPGAANGIN